MNDEQRTSVKSRVTPLRQLNGGVYRTQSQQVQVLRPVEPKALSGVQVQIAA
ncbi:hypothetical protein [Streptomyces sp. Root1310]|uniref:hypothetical protein n=1 Tax=Streptomyces sp. Root1310 TaxID=1736452 RepID=UPI0012FEB109|nr:hypothetical protein [Streptomyces sp. Root1310]